MREMRLKLIDDFGDEVDEVRITEADLDVFRQDVLHLADDSPDFPEGWGENNLGVFRMMLAFLDTEAE